RAPASSGGRAGRAGARAAAAVAGGRCREAAAAVGIEELDLPGLERELDLGARRGAARGVETGDDVLAAAGEVLQARVLRQLGQLVGLHVLPHVDVEVDVE